MYCIRIYCIYIYICKNVQLVFFFLMRIVSVVFLLLSLRANVLAVSSFLRREVRGSNGTPHHAGDNVHAADENGKNNKQLTTSLQPGSRQESDVVLSAIRPNEFDTDTEVSLLSARIHEPSKTKPSGKAIILERKRDLLLARSHARLFAPFVCLRLQKQNRDVSGRVNFWSKLHKTRSSGIFGRVVRYFRRKQQQDANAVLLDLLTSWEAELFRNSQSEDHLWLQVVGDELKYLRKHNCPVPHLEAGQSCKTQNMSCGVGLECRRGPLFKDKKCVDKKIEDDTCVCRKSKRDSKLIEVLLPNDDSIAKLLASGLYNVVAGDYLVAGSRTNCDTTPKNHNAENCNIDVEWPSIYSDKGKWLMQLFDLYVANIESQLDISENDMSLLQHAARVDKNKEEEDALQLHTARVERNKEGDDSLLQHTAQVDRNKEEEGALQLHYAQVDSNKEGGNSLRLHTSLVDANKEETESLLQHTVGERGVWSTIKGFLTKQKDIDEDDDNTGLVEEDEDEEDEDEENQEDNEPLAVSVYREYIEKYHTIQLLQCDDCQNCCNPQLPEVRTKKRNSAVGDKIRNELAQLRLADHEFYAYSRYRAGRIQFSRKFAEIRDHEERSIPERSFHVLSEPDFRGKPAMWHEESFAWELPVDKLRRRQRLFDYFSPMPIMRRLWANYVADQVMFHDRIHPTMPDALKSLTSELKARDLDFFFGVANSKYAMGLHDKSYDLNHLLNAPKTGTLERWGRIWDAANNLNDKLSRHCRGTEWTENYLREMVSAGNRDMDAAVSMWEDGKNPGQLILLTPKLSTKEQDDMSDWLWRRITPNSGEPCAEGMSTLHLFRGECVETEKDESCGLVPPEPDEIPQWKELIAVALVQELKLLQLAIPKYRVALQRLRNPEGEDKARNFLLPVFGTPEDPKGDEYMINVRCYGKISRKILGFFRRLVRRKVMHGSATCHRIRKMVRLLVDYPPMRENEPIRLAFAKLNWKLG
eukprot:GEMP01002272.1.p1 GENE.GEMP01002272.1~~GEMP01002272.1.p1  ORF type:complete len:983 (+),score=115.27 GEMP01002272.1:776-3724(+)